MSRPPLRRGITIHDIPQSKEQSEETLLAHKELKEIKRQIALSPALRRKQSKRVLTRIEKLAPPVKSHSFQRDLIDTGVLFQQRSRYRRANAKITDIVTRGDVVPTLGEVIDNIYSTDSLIDIVQYATDQPDDAWNNTNVCCLVYSRGKVRPKALMVSYLICLEMLRKCTQDTILRSDNLLSRLLVVWSPPIIYNFHLSKKCAKTARRILLESLQHLQDSNIDFVQLLQTEIYNRDLQPDGTPVVVANLFLRHYIPQFRQQYSRSPETIGRVCILVQSYINGYWPEKLDKDIKHLQSSKRLSQAMNNALYLFKND